MMPFIVDIDPYIVDILIEREKSKQKETYSRPYLEIPLEPPSDWQKNEEKDNNNDNDDIIIIDL